MCGRSEAWVHRKTGHLSISIFSFSHQAIHPNQISVIDELFRPSESELAFARRVVEGDRQHQGVGKVQFLSPFHLISGSVCFGWEND